MTNVFSISKIVPQSITKIRNVFRQEERKAAMRSRRVRLLAVTGVFSASIGATIILLPTDPVIAAQMDALKQRWFGSPQRTLNDILNPGVVEQRDPALETILLDNDTGRELRSKAKQERSAYLLVFTGDCAGCLRVDFREWYKQAKQNNMQILAFASGERTNIRAMQMQLRQLNVDISIVQDERSQATSALNAYYAGRAYLFDKKWHLKWMAHSLGSSTFMWSDPVFRDALKEAQQ